MAATLLISGYRRLLVAFLAACALVLALAGTAFAQNGNGNGGGNGGGNGNGCNAPGNAYGHDNCDPPADPPPADPPPAPPSGGDAAPPASEGSAPADATPPADGSSAPDGEEAPSNDSPPAQPESSGDAPAPPVPSAPAPQAETPVAAPAPAAPDSSPSSPSPPPPDPGPPAAGWAPVVGRSNQPDEKPAPNPTAPRGRTFSSTSAPEASWGAGQPDASWGAGASQPDAQQYGVTGTGAVITIRRRHGVFGGLSFRVSMTPGSSSYVFRASRSVVAGSGGRLYRIGAWLRSDVPGITLCLRIQEVAPADPLTSVRTSESCLSPTKSWKKFRAFRRTLARGNKLVFSIYSYGAVAGDSFEVDGFTVERRITNGWKRVDAAFGDAPETN